MKVIKTFHDHCKTVPANQTYLNRRFIVVPVLCSNNSYYCLVIDPEAPESSYCEGASNCIEGTLAFTKEQLLLGQRSPSAWELPSTP